MAKRHNMPVVKDEDPKAKINYAPYISLVLGLGLINITLCWLVDLGRLDFKELETYINNASGLRL